MPRYGSLRWISCGAVTRQMVGPVKTLLRLVAVLTALCGVSTASVGSDGGRIINVVTTNSQLLLSFEANPGCDYQVQSAPDAESVRWVDIPPRITSTGNLAGATCTMPSTSAFFHVLEFTNRVFWYDWRYFYESPVLANWALGTSQTSYAHVDRPYDWYVDQADTGQYSGNNCGPSSVAMAMKWYNQNSTNTAADARRTYPNGGGWWYTSDIINYLGLYSIPHTISAFTGTNQIVEILNQKNLVILCISTAYLTRDYTDQRRTGRFYDYASGHFLVVKGWRRTNSGLFFEVYDPNNWHAAYGDKTPKGRNRHQLSSDLSRAISNWWNYLIVIQPPSARGAAASIEPPSWLVPVDPKQIPHNWGL